MNKSAFFSTDHKYRYRLDRSWEDGRWKWLCFCMLNPSTANEFEDDPTVRRCIGFAKDWDYSGIVIVNLFALVSSDPRKLLTDPEPVGVDNDSHIRTAAMMSTKIVVAWGNYGTHLAGRIDHVLKILNWKPVFCLGINKSGQPKHPLYATGMLEFALQVYRPAIVKLG